MALFKKLSFRFEPVISEHRKHKGEVKLPTRGSKNACAYDFYAPADCVVFPHESKMIWTDVKAILSPGYMLMLNVRSSMGKHLVSLANTQGWIDSDYAHNPDNDGNIGIMLHNGGNETYVVRTGDRIAQGMIVQYWLTDDDDTEEKRHGGFGSTGK